MTIAQAGAMARPMKIYKILRAEEWKALLASGETQGAPVDLADGYVHFSTAAQTPETLAKHFAGEEGLVILAFDSDAMGDALKWERSRGGALFPHLYGPLRLAEALWSVPVALAPNGLHVVPGSIE